MTDAIVSENRTLVQASKLTSFGDGPLILSFINSGVDTAGNRNAIFRDHIEFHAMFIDLRQLSWCGNGEREGGRRLPFSSRSFFPIPLFLYLGFVLNRIDKFSDLFIAG